MSVESLLHQALQLPPDERSAFLAQSGADPDLRARVEAMLAALATRDLPAGGETGAYAPPPPDPNATSDFAFVTVTDTADPSTGVGIGRIFAGRYLLREKLGEGGMGTVWLAEQTAPIKRRVALKLIRAGLDSRTVLARFEAERQALALMDHPGIARVFDGGLADGMPYFVMELVQGEPITAYCDRRRLTPTQRLDLFVQVCQAVQHAHQKGIIHRDLKPGNVLVSEVDGRPAPKVIDFGVAKATEQKLTDETIQEAGLIVGTPSYMSPEQADPECQDIDTRTDVYALGVMLYELLVGSPPIDARQFRRGAMLEMLRMVREEEPSKPSTKVSTADALPNIAANRGVEPSQLQSWLRGDIDWIVMKALEKERGRRYDSANSFAEDIRRHLAHEPVQAAPPSRIYRLRKFVRKNRGTVLAASLLFLALLAGFVGTLLGLLEARRQGEAALAERDAKELSRQAEAVARAKAETREKETAAVLKFVEDKVFAAGRPEGQAGGLGREVTLHRAILAALPAVEAELAAHPVIQARVRATIAATLVYLSDLSAALPLLRQARDAFRTHLGPDHADTLASSSQHALTAFVLGQRAEALAEQQDVVARRQRILGEAHPETLRAQSFIARARFEMGQRKEAVELLEKVREGLTAALGPEHSETLTVSGNLAVGYAFTGRLEEALRLREAVHAGYLAKHGPSHPDTLRAAMLLAHSYTTLGRHQEALALHEKTLAIRQEKLGPNHLDTLRSGMELAIQEFQLGQYEKAAGRFRESLAGHRKILPAGHPELLALQNNLAGCELMRGRPEEALPLFQETLAARRDKLGPLHPDTLGSVQNLVTTLELLNRGKEALPELEATLQAAAGGTDPGSARRLLVLRQIACQFRGDEAGCRSAYRELAAGKPTQPGELFEMACHAGRVGLATQLADPSPAGTQRAAQDAEETMAWLRKAIAAGYRDNGWIRREKALDLVRDRPDFQKLVAELENPAKPKSGN